MYRLLLDMGKTRKNFYAVRVGRSTGVFNSWSECEAQVKKYPGAIYKGFQDRLEADGFVSCGGNYSSSGGCGDGGGSSGDGAGSSGGGDANSVGGSYISSARKRYSGNFKSRYSLSKRKSDVDVDVDVDVAGGYKYCSTSSGSSLSGCSYGRRVVYSDGCCTNNGFKGASAGIGVYWGDGHPQNLSEKLVGLQTNQRAELVAASRAIESALDQGISSVELKTDSIYTIKAATEWIAKWKNNGWRTSNCEDVKNKEDIQRLDDLCRRMDVKWTHVRGHVGIPGNEAADSLAKAGSQK